MSERSPEQRTRRTDKWIPVAAGIGVVIILALGVVSTVAFLGIGKAEDAAAEAKDAAADARAALERTTANAATIDDFCQIVRQQREEVEIGVKATHDFLNAPVAKELPGFTAYIEQVSLPQAQARLDNFFVPDSCTKETRHG